MLASLDVERLFQSLEYVVDSIHWLSDDTDRLDKFESENEGSLAKATHSLELAVSRVRSLRNRHIRVNTIPTEILGRIFECLASNPLPIHPSVSPIFRTADRPSYAWTRAMLVCQHWRAVALHTPSLWAVIEIIELGGMIIHDDMHPSPDLSFPTISLQRSGGVPLIARLDIPVGYPWRDGHALMAEVLTQMHRMQELRLSLYHGDLFDAEFLKDVDAHTPRLETLVLHIGGESTREIEETSDEEYQSLHRLFEPERVPQLRTVAVDNYHSWPKWSLRNLRNLYIGTQRSYPLEGLRSLLDIVSANVTLESLVLYDWEASEGHQSTFTDDRNPIPMPNLQHVVVSDCDISVYYLVNHWLQLPATSARWYSNRHANLRWESAFHNGDVFEADQIHVCTRKIIGRSSQSAFCISGGLPSSFARVIRTHISLDKLEGLSIAETYHEFHAGRTRWPLLMQKMTALTSLTFAAGIPNWLEIIGSTPDIIPRLTDIRIHDTDAGRFNFSCLTSFLLRSSEHGRLQPSLNITVSPEMPDQYAILSRWHDLEDRLVEIARKVSYDLVGLDRPPLQLPDVCIRQTPVEGFWYRQDWFEW